MDNFERQLAVLVKEWAARGSHPVSMARALAGEVEALLQVQWNKIDIMHLT